MAAQVTPRPGDFACVPVGGLAGPLISFGEWLNGSEFGRFDHAYVYVGVPAGYGAAGQGRYGWKVQAEPGGAQIRPLHSEADVDMGALWSTGTVPLSSGQRAAIVTAALGYLGTPYSVLDYLALAAHRLHLPVAGLRRYVASTGHMICSQLVDQCYADAGVHLFDDGRWPGFVTPADLAALVQGAGP